MMNENMSKNRFYANFYDQTDEFKTMKFFLLHYRTLNYVYDW